MRIKRKTGIWPVQRISKIERLKRENQRKQRQKKKKGKGQIIDFYA